MKSKLFFTSISTIAGLYSLLILILLLIFNICGFSLDLLLIISIVVLIIQFLIAPFITDLTMKVLYRVKFDFNIPNYLKEYIEKVCKENKIFAFFKAGKYINQDCEIKGWYKRSI